MKSDESVYLGIDEVQRRTYFIDIMDDDGETRVRVNVHRLIAQLLHEQRETIERLSSRANILAEEVRKLKNDVQS